jgi:hypothetical protein
MRDILKSRGRRLRGGWFWSLVLLALPACGLNTSGTGPAFDPGSEPRSGAIMCDIPKVPEEARSNPCATEAEVNVGIPLAEAAIALRNGKSSTIGLDFSKPCANGMPRKTLFHGPFPMAWPSA